MLDLICKSIIEYESGDTSEYYIFTQPGMRYSIAKSLVYSLLQDKYFSSISLILPFSIVTVPPIGVSPFISTLSVFSSLHVLFTKSTTAVFAFPLKERAVPTVPPPGVYQDHFTSTLDKSFGLLFSSSLYGKEKIFPRPPDVCRNGDRVFSRHGL